MSWIYQGTFLNEAPEEYEGFVYVIHNFQTKRYYIGQKRFWTVKKLPPLKGRKNRRHKRVETDWRDYWGSSEALQADIDALGQSNFSRTILTLCKTKGDINYEEARLQFQYGVLKDPLAYNGIINCKIHRSHLSKSD